MSLPRIITVDPTFTLARLLRSAIDMLDRSVIQVDVPTSSDALAELGQNTALVISTFEIDERMKGFELAIQVKQRSPKTAVLVLGEEGDPEELDQETADESPFVYLCRPTDAQRLMRVLETGLNGGDIKAAVHAPAAAMAAASHDFGPVPGISVEAAQQIIDRLLIDLGAMAIILATRTGEVLLERGAVGYLNREKLAGSLTPAVTSAINVKDLVGGQMSTIQFFDGDAFDVFMLSVGLHHFLCAVFDGQIGSRQFGVVTRFGRRAVEDMVALIGANAFIIQPPVRPAEETRKAPAKARAQKQAEPEYEEPLVPSGLGLEMPVAEPEPLQLDPIAADPNELAALFSDGVAEANFDDLFDLDDLEEAARTAQQPNTKDKLDWVQATQIGLLGKK